MLCNARVYFKMAEALINNKTITHLDLQRNTIRSEGIKAILNSLKGNLMISFLNLSDNLCLSRKYPRYYDGEGVLELFEDQNEIKKVIQIVWFIEPSKFICTLI